MSPKYFQISHFYIQDETGAAFALNKNEIGADHTVVFIYAPQVGVERPLSGKSYIDAGVCYERSTNFNSNSDDCKVSFIVLRLAYAFSVK